MTKKTTFLFFLLGMTFQVFSQIGLIDTEHLEELRNGTTYVISNNYDSDEMAPYRMAFIQNWTYSDISFISPDQKKQYSQPGNSFIYIGGYTRYVTMTTQVGDNPANSSSLNSQSIHPQMELTIVVEREKPNEREEPTVESQVAFLELFVDFETSLNLGSLQDEGFSGGEKIRGWGPGVLKNKIQQLNALLEEGEENTYYKPDTHKEQMINLQSQTLLVPDYVLIHFAPTTGDESERVEEEELLADYSYPYEMVTTEELNQRILSGEQVYYLNYVKIVANKYIEVVNSETGEIVYAETKNLSYNIKNKDFKALSKTVSRAK